jgi:hypothetical protein
MEDGKAGTKQAHHLLALAQAEAKAAEKQVLAEGGKMREKKEERGK